MSQSNVIAGFLVAAFLIFITARGRLPKYAAIFVGPVSGDGGSSNSDAAAPSQKSGGINPLDILVDGPNAAGLFIREKLGF